MNETRTRDQIAAEIVEFFKVSNDALTECIEELDDYNGYLNDDRHYDMYMLNDVFSGTEPSEILRRAFYGHDAETWTTDSCGYRKYGAFNPNREYFHFDGYGNLVSSDCKDYSAFNDKYLVRELSEHRVYIDSIDNYDELAELFDEYKNAEGE